MGRVKILFVLTTTIGGTGLHAYYMARGLDKAKFEVTVAYGPGYPLDTEIEKLGVPVYHLRMKRSLSPGMHLIALVQLYRLMRRERFHIVCTYCSIAGLLGRVAAKLAGVRVSVFCIHLLAAHDYLPRLTYWLYLWIERGLDLITDHYIAVSDAMKQEGRQKRIFPARKVSVVANALDLPRFAPRDVSHLTSQLGLSESHCVVGTIGRLERQKGISDFLHAMAITLRSVPQARFLIVGDGPLRAEMEDLAWTLGLAHRATFTGWVAEPQDYLACMDVFCLASLWEAFGFVLVEAMAMTKPVVATRVGGVPEVVTDGQTGFLVPAQNPEAMAQRVVRLLRDPALAQRFGEAGRERVEKHFVLEQMLTEYEGILLTLVNRAQRRGVWRDLQLRP